MWARKPWLEPAESERTRIGVPCRWVSGIWARAWSRTVMWSTVVFEPARPSRSRPARASPVLSRKHSSGWKRTSSSRCGWPIPCRSGRSRWSRRCPGPGRRPVGRRRSAGAGRRGPRRAGPRRSRGPGPGRPAARPVPWRRAAITAATRSDRRRPARTGPPGHADRQIGDGLAAVSEHHGEIDRDPARVVPALPLPLPQPGQRLAECAGQTSRVSEIGEQPGTVVTDHAAPVSGHHDLRTCCGSLHPASAFRDGLPGLSTSPIFPDQKALLRFRSIPWAALNEGPRLERRSGGPDRLVPPWSGR